MTWFGIGLSLARTHVRPRSGSDAGFGVASLIGLRHVAAPIRHGAVPQPDCTHGRLPRAAALFLGREKCNGPSGPAEQVGVCVNGSHDGFSRGKAGGDPMTRSAQASVTNQTQTQTQACVARRIIRIRYIMEYYEAILSLTRKAFMDVVKAQGKQIDGR